LAALEARGWSQSDLSRELGVAPAIVSRWATADRVPALANALELQKLLGIDPALWQDEVPPDAEPAANDDAPPESGSGDSAPRNGTDP
jgi:ribosome-binding protein aMBF1 (putative translation factor)